MTQSNLSDHTQMILNDFMQQASALKQNPDPQKVEALRVTFLGRKGRMSELMDTLKTAKPEERPAAGKAINELRVRIETELDGLKHSAQDATLNKKLSERRLDISLPCIQDHFKGSLHPVTLMRRELLREFRRLGFTVYDGPEIDYDFYNFGALNFPENHPARDMQDTFFVADEKDMLLRTHTSNIQVHAMLNHRPPLRVVAPGRTFRCDSDLTHTPMFHQIEGFVVDRGVSFADMKGLITHFLRGIYGSEAKSRFRPSFFPFVEPGAEFDMGCVSCSGKGCRICKETGWLEIGGCGMIHPNVFEAVDYDSEEFTGFAFGFGIDRMAMLKYDLPDLRQLFEGDHMFLSQFPVY